jgi:geranylgeranyl pyrophosphate synthase
MCSYKTGVLARFAARLGGIVAGATAKQLEALGKFGETVGIAFQIQDDILNLVGEEFQKGKGVGEDIHEGKRTLLVIRALQKASEADKKRLLDILNSHPSDEATIREAIEIIKKYGGIEYAQAKAEELVKKAWKQIDSALKDSDAKDTLKSLAEYAVKRQV